MKYDSMYQKLYTISIKHRRHYEKEALTRKETLAIGLMLFALFFGAGNMIFPPSLGQQAGVNTWSATVGFLITGVGLPLLGIIAISKTNGDFTKIANRVHPIFGIFFTIVLYLAIGPFLVFQEQIP